MKLITHCLILFLIISITSESSLNDYSIDRFKDYLKEKGIFQIIQSIFNAYGKDVAIISCEEINGNYKGNCKKLVTDYMTKQQHEHIFKTKSIFGQVPGIDISIRSKNNHLFSSQKLSKFIIFKHSKKLPAIKFFLRKRFNQWTSNNIYNKIIKKVKFNK